MPNEYLYCFHLSKIIGLYHIAIVMLTLYVSIHRPCIEICINFSSKIPIRK